MLLRVAAAVLLLAAACAAYTDPNEVQRLWALRSELLSRGLGDRLGTWQCPNGLQNCNPCGKFSGDDGSWGYLGGGGGWEHIACRTYDMTPAEFPGLWRQGMDISRMGVVTTIHITDEKIPGPLETLGKVLCPFVHLRELDLDGSALTGTIPRWIADCFPHLHELDLSFGQLSGSIPDWVPSMGSHLQQFKVQQNQLSGVVPSGFGGMSKLRVLWLHHNPGLSGSLPADLANSNSLISIDVRENPKLCGVVPPGLHVVSPPGDWTVFCSKASSEDNSGCSVLTQPGTGIGKPC